MKIDFTKPLRDFDGNIIKDGDRTLTVRDIVNRSLMGTMPNKQGTALTSAEAVSAFEIATRMMRTPEAMEVTAADMVLLDKAISLVAWAPLVYGQVKKILDGQATGLEVVEPPVPE